MSAEQALLFLESVCERLELVSLDPQEYRKAIHEAAGAGVVGGAIYDALLVECGRKTRATTILTWNLTHFQRIGRDIADRVQNP